MASITEYQSVEDIVVKICLFFSSPATFVVRISLLISPLLIGCGGPGRIAPPSIDADDAAELAMETYDTDRDGLVSGEELKKAPGLNAATETLDMDRDGSVSEQEIVERIQRWQQRRVGLTFAPCVVLMNGKPLEGATVTYDPEEFLGDNLKAAIGTTNYAGEASQRIPKESRPSPDSPPGMHVGLYKVRISKIVNGQETIPRKYNSDTILGQEVSSVDKAMSNNQIRFRIKSR